MIRVVPAICTADILLTMPLNPADATNGRVPTRLRFGIMCSGNELPGAFAKCVDELLAIPGAELALIIVDASSPVQTTAWQKIKRVLSFQGSLWALAKRISPLQKLPCY